MMKKPKTFATNFGPNDLTVKLGEKLINPTDMLQHKNGNVYVKRLKCRICNYRAAWESEMARHEYRVHNFPEKKKAPPRPIPNLIPIQNKGTQPLNAVKGIRLSFDKSPGGGKPENHMSEKDLNDICAKSCPNSSLKDFASLIGDAEAFKTADSEMFTSALVGSGTSAFPLEKKENSRETSSSPIDFKKTPDSFKKKNASFFDKLKEKLMTGVSESSNLICTYCGYESKCLSESVRHQKLHTGKGNGNNNTCNGNSLISGTELSSTRCQHCRQRCKTSADLYYHLQTCTEANKRNTESLYDQGGDQTDDDKRESNEEFFDGDEKSMAVDETKEPHPMENKVFVWNNIPEREENERPKREENTPRKSPAHEGAMVGVETSPGYGAITSKNKSGSQGHNIPLSKEKRKSDHSLKKVYKCPHCSFWASTASRFHVHIVGHLNKKPFECSLCAYRSNWRWDITKHIRLKTVRDVSHERARVLMTDETGRRNYSKYNKYLTLMRVHEPTAESSGSGRRSKSQPASPQPDFPLSDGSSPQPTSPLPPAQLPAPPKLTPAPVTIQPVSSPPHQLQPLPPLAHFRAIYPKPPPLQPSLNIKRSTGSVDENSSMEEPPKKKSNLENKKTMWKCKKCFFRDGDRAVVLAHVKEHYRSSNNQQKEAGQDIQKGKYTEGYQNEQEGDNKVGKQNELPANNGDHQVPEGDTGEVFKCPSCPFFGDSQDSLTDHIHNHHSDSTDDLFKCFFCPFYVSDKQKLIEHMGMHGLQEAEEFSSKAGNRLSPPKKNIAESGETSPSKRYKCSGCPYVSNSKSQFLYHKQFHRPRGAPFKCTMCTYNVTRRHLLHQHLRVHGINVPTQKIKETGYDEVEENTEPNPEIGQIDTSALPEIPLVWVSKLGNLTKMFKCRFCPHVNIRKSNIQEHEKMHGQRNKLGVEGATSPSHQQQHRCPDCNYVCNNAGVLSSHAKVHQGLFGLVCSLVDNTRSDDVQIKELNALLGRNEEGPPVITPEEMKKEPKQSSEYNLQSSVEESLTAEGDKLLRFCSTCPARFLFQKELDIHTRFHSLNLSHRCESCSYTARQRPHLLAHYKVHTDEYQDRTNALCKMYEVSPDHPKPKIAIIVEGPSDVGPAWVVVPPPEFPRTPEEMDDAPCSPSLEDESPSVVQHGNRAVHKQFSCNKCPAQFFKSIALQYHLTLHGGNGRYKCRSCDYAVKTYGNLIKHEAVHEQLEPRLKQKTKGKKNEVVVPTSGTELFRQKTEAAQKVAATPPPPPPPPPPLHIDPEFGVLMHGSPEFIYPTYLKNGRLKEKRYKCHKCPSAFEKREQYKVHLSLHGSKQRYNCERCDYSVKYYANYIQHLRKHQSNDATVAERKLSTDRSSDEHGSEDVSESTDATSEDIQGPPVIAQRCAKSLQMSMADQQTMMLLQQRVVGNSISAPEILNRCPHCPYSNQRRDGVGSHVKCHSNGKTGAFACKHCSYTVPQQHFLREHNKLHFTPVKGMRPEAYMKCDRLELWSEPVNPTNGERDKVLIFKDKGSNYKGDRFLPQLSFGSADSEEENNEKTYINLKNGEIDNEQEIVDDLKEDNKENLSVTLKQDIMKSVVGEGPAETTVSNEDPPENGILPTNDSDGSGDEHSSVKEEVTGGEVMEETNANSTEDQTLKTQTTPSCDSEETTSDLSSGDTEDESSSSNSCSSTED